MIGELCCRDMNYRVRFRDYISVLQYSKAMVQIHVVWVCYRVVEILTLGVKTNVFGSPLRIGWHGDNTRTFERG